LGRDIQHFQRLLKADVSIRAHPSASCCGFVHALCRHFVIAFRPRRAVALVGETGELQRMPSLNQRVKARTRWPGGLSTRAFSLEWISAAGPRSPAVLRWIQFEFELPHGAKLDGDAAIEILRAVQVENSLDSSAPRSLGPAHDLPKVRRADFFFASRPAPG